MTTEIVDSQELMERIAALCIEIEEVRLERDKYRRMLAAMLPHLLDVQEALKEGRTQEPIVFSNGGDEMVFKSRFVQ